MDLSKNMRLDFEIDLNGWRVAGPHSRCQNIIKVGQKIDFDLVLNGPRPPQFLAGLQPKLSTVPPPFSHSKT